MKDLIERLRKRAEIRRQIPTRKSVQEGAPDRISDLLEEAANAVESLLKTERQIKAEAFREAEKMITDPEDQYNLRLIATTYDDEWQKQFWDVTDKALGEFEYETTKAAR